jgi:hypothetical protein
MHSEARARRVRQSGVCTIGGDLGPHIYNLRASAKYRRQAANFEPTRPSVGITSASGGGRSRGADRAYLRVDTVHQGDWDGEKGVYHINAVDAVTQWEAVGCAPRINAENLKPVLEAMLHQFPFPILGAHFDNGSEYINYKIEEMMKALMVEFTKSRACRSQDNALVEGKNGAIIRKLIGYGHIPGRTRRTCMQFYTAHLNPYLNFHRPCGFATVSLDAKGKRERKVQGGGLRHTAPKAADAARRGEQSQARESAWQAGIRRPPR